MIWITKSFQILLESALIAVTDTFAQHPQLRRRAIIIAKCSLLKREEYPFYNNLIL